LTAVAHGVDEALAILRGWHSDRRRHQSNRGAFWCGGEPLRRVPRPKVVLGWSLLVPVKLVPLARARTFREFGSACRSYCPAQWMIEGMAAVDSSRLYW